MFLNRTILAFFWFQTVLLSITSLVILCYFLCLPLLYKRLPSKVILLSLVLNVYFIGFQPFSEGKLYSSTSLIFNYCIAYRNNIVSRRNIWAHLGTRWGFSEAQANIVELIEVPNSNSEEPTLTNSINATTGKPRFIILLF